MVVITQAWLVISGNYAWLNVTTMLLGVSAIDDRALAHVLPLRHPLPVTVGWHDGLVAAVALLVIALSWRPARNLVSRQQVMNASFDALHLVNTYGAFGSVTRERDEVVLEGTSDETITARTEWREYGFRAKPGDPKRRPPQWAPYHLRLDWLMWFAALSPGYAGAWLLPMLEKLLNNDRALLRLLRRNPFPDAPPHAVRAVLYRYRFTTWRERRETGAFWVRTRLGEYVRPITLGDFGG